MQLVMMKRVAEKNLVDLFETTNGTFIVEFDNMDGSRPLLVSADNGKTWCPECMGPNGKMWSGMVMLRGVLLVKEITEMYMELKLGSPAKMIKVAKELEDQCVGELIC